jgi:hypothetical protein
MTDRIRDQKTRRARWGVVAGAVLLACTLASPVTAQEADTRRPISEEPAARAELMGWGPRVGVGTDPDQVIGGLHWVVGRITPHFRIVPNLEFGVGDDHTILAATVPLHFVFRDVDVNFFPYVGGGLTLGWIDHDHEPHGVAHGHDHDDDGDLEAAAKAIGGLEWRLTRQTDFFTEANVVVGDLHDIPLMMGWTFRR